MLAQSKLHIYLIRFIHPGVQLKHTFLTKEDPKMVSEFGKYQGYTKKVYASSVRKSDFLILSNGTRLAYDLILPTRKGIPADEPLPVLFKYTPYLRTFTIFDQNGKDVFSDLLELGWKERAMLRVRYWIYKRGSLMDPLFRTKWLEQMVQHGYGVVVVERPGTGASFGVMNPSFKVGAKEVDEILNWIAAQPWCDGNIGMFGDSWQAQIQFAAASTGNQHIKAIFPCSSSLENYSAVIYPGGVFNKSFSTFFSWSTGFLEKLVTPVDSDLNRGLLEQARTERGKSTVGAESANMMVRFPFRDSLTTNGKQIWKDDFTLYPFIERINRYGVPIYMINGWYDLFTNDMFLWYANLTVPKRLMARPLDHSQIDANQFDLDYAAEALRWFDFWLKGIDNGIMDEPPIHYYRMERNKKGRWQASDRWPLLRQESTRYYFRPGRTGSVGSINDGLLSPAVPTPTETFDPYQIDYTTSMGKHSRWTAVNWELSYPDLRENDQKALTYTTPELENDVEITGHPIVRLWFCMDAPDLDVFVYLEMVDHSGRSSYITEGNLRASHRKLSLAPFNNLGLPYQTHHQGDLIPVPQGEPCEMVFRLLPSSFQFHIGDRIRITVAFADAGNFDTSILDPAPVVKILRDVAHPSLIELPVIRDH